MARGVLANLEVPVLLVYHLLLVYRVHLDFLVFQVGLAYQSDLLSLVNR